MEGILCYFPALYTHLLELVPDLATDLGDGSSERVDQSEKTINVVNCIKL